MSGDMMLFPDTVEEFMETYKIVDVDQVYTNGMEMVPIFRMRQWFEHEKMNQWIPVTERLPEEKINRNTHDFEEVLCTTTFGDVRVYKFGKPIGWEEPHFWNGAGNMDKYVTAWMPKPEPFREVDA